jgi:hypothetical protein
MCPAVMLAASRKDKVSGRTETLTDSIITRNGLSQSGAPSGNRCAADALGAFTQLEIMKAAHIGSPSLRVITKCLDNLKT